MRQGKLTTDELKSMVLDVVKRRRKEVITSASLGEDCASFKSDRLILISTDPITATTNDMGSLSIKVASNDIYAAGGEPLLAVVTIIVPPNSSIDLIKSIMLEVEKEAEKQNIEIVGGHTEFSDAVNRVVMSVTVVGLTDRHVRATSPQIGDSILVTKSIGLEGTFILGREHEDKLNLSASEKSELIKYYDSISISKEAKVLNSIETVSSMHDITEGGIFGAVAEVCEGARVGALIETNHIPITKLTRKICNKLNVDPYGLISSGSLMITTKTPEIVIKKLEEKGISCSIVGVINSGKAQAILENGKIIELKTRADELFLK